VIFRFENAPDSQTGFIPQISQNIRAVFSRIRAILGVGNPSGEDSLRRRSSAGKRAGFLLVLWGISDPHNSLMYAGKNNRQKMLTRISLRSFRIFYEPAQQS